MGFVTAFAIGLTVVKIKQKIANPYGHLREERVEFSRRDEDRVELGDLPQVNNNTLRL